MTGKIVVCIGLSTFFSAIFGAVLVATYKHPTANGVLIILFEFSLMLFWIGFSIATINSYVNELKERRLVSR